MLIFAGCVLLVLSTVLFWWEFEKDEVFKDDWIEIAQVLGSLVLAGAGIACLVVAIS
jgi:hypothetical protein